MMLLTPGLTNPGLDVTATFEPALTSIGAPTTLTVLFDNWEGTEDVIINFFTLNLNIDGSGIATTSISTTCAVASSSGTTFLIVTGFTILAGSSCSFSVPVTALNAGQFTVVSSNIGLGNGDTIDPFLASITIVDDLSATATVPTFTRELSPSTIESGGKSTIIYTIDNSGMNVEVTDLAFAEVIDASSNVVVSFSPSIVSTCSGSIVTAEANSKSIAVSGGTVAARGICTISVDVTSTDPTGTTIVFDAITLTSNVENVESNSAALSIETFVSDASLPVITQSFVPNTIGLGGTSTLTYAITNPGNSAILDGTFTNTLPTGMDVANSPNVASSCKCFSLDASPGDDVITFLGAIGADQFCSISVDVTSSFVGTSTNSPFLFTSTGRPDATANGADLTVSSSLPSFSMSFSPDTVLFGSRTTLTYTIDNSLSASDIGSLDFVHNLPKDLVIADPSNASTTCNGDQGSTLTAVPGTTTIILNADGFTFIPGFETLAAGASCTVTVDLIVRLNGEIATTTGNLLSDFVAAGKASGIVTGFVSEGLLVVKEFVDNPVAPGGTSILQYSISRLTIQPELITDISFAEDLTTISPFITLGSSGLPISDACGSGSTFAVNGNNLQLTGGSLSSGTSCTFGLSVQVGADTIPGTYELPTITGTATGSEVFTFETNSELLFVAPNLIFTTRWVVDVVAPGDDAILEVTIENTSTTSGATDISWQSNSALTDVLGFPLSVTLPTLPNPPCGSGSTFGIFDLATNRQGLQLIGGILNATGSSGDSCTFRVSIGIPTSQNGLLLFPVSDIAKQVGELVGTVDAAPRTTSTFWPQLTVAPDELPTISAVVVAGSMCATADGAAVSLSAVTPERSGDRILWTVFTDSSEHSGLNPEIPLGIGDNTIEVVVTDAIGRMASDQIVVEVVENQPPVANSGGDQFFFDAPASGVDVILDGTASFDPEGSFAFAWTINGIEFDLELLTTVNLPIGVNAATLSVTDECGIVSTDTSIISISASSNSPSLSPSLSLEPSISLRPSTSFPPSVSVIPSSQPSSLPSSAPSLSAAPSSQPSSAPSTSPSTTPSVQPSSKPSSAPSLSVVPSSSPSLAPSTIPSKEPSLSSSPSTEPSTNPSSSNVPSVTPSTFPSSEPTRQICVDNPLFLCNPDDEDENENLPGIVTYTAICTERKKNEYEAQCVESSSIVGLGEGDVEPDKNRLIISCGCCPDDGTKVKTPKSGTPWCESTVETKRPKATKTPKDPKRRVMTTTGGGGGAHPIRQMKFRKSQPTEDG